MAPWDGATTPSHCLPRHLVQRGLGHRVILYVAGAAVGGQKAEDGGQGGDTGREVVLQQPPVLLPQHNAREMLLQQRLHRCRARAPRPHHHRVPIPKPAGRGDTAVSAGVATTPRRLPWPPPQYLFLRCWTLPRQRKRPLTMMAILVQSASHSSMLGGHV